MMHYFHKALLALVFLFCGLYSHSTIVLVQNNNDNGAGSLRDVIINANAGDTVMMNVKGTINLVSPINISKPLAVFGAYPIYSVIDCITNGDAFSVTANVGDQVIIQGFTFKNNSSSNATINVVNGCTVKILDCVFEDNNGSANGQCIYVGATSNLEVINCSFINNSTSNSGGGGIFIDLSTNAAIRNCTFFQNMASVGSGGAIYNLANNTSITNNTFLDNNATAGADIFNNGLSELYNNVISNSNPTLSLQYPGGNWNSPGGNVFSGSNQSQYGGPDVNGPSTIFAGLQSSIGIASSPITDGYGLKFIRIIQQTSPCVDNGLMGAFILPNDCKRAPRVLYGDNALLPDAGAVEYTPFTVTNNLAGVGDIPNTWNAMNLSGFPGPKYMDFAMGSATNRTLSTTLNNSSAAAGEDWIVDGFTQQGSVIPGPGNTPTDVTPGIFSVQINNANTDVMFLSNCGFNSWISGLYLNNAINGNVALECNNTNFKIFGNKFVSSDPGIPANKSGIYLSGSADCVIGGWRHHMRNVISQQGYGIFMQSPHMLVMGNFIGTNDNGTAILSNFQGIRQEGGNMEVIGRFKYPSMNLISGSIDANIDIYTGSVFKIYGNLIGTDYSVSNGIGYATFGIRANLNTDGAIGNGMPFGFNVICSNDRGIQLNNSNAVDIFGNYIGFSPLGTFPAIPNGFGIFINGNGDASHNIGNGTFSGRNYISNNSFYGIRSNNAQGHSIQGNFIGLKPDNSSAGNLNGGIWLDNGSDSYTIRKNVISSNDGEGINYSSSGANDLIQDNYIGTDSTGTLARSNTSYGIFLSVSGSGIIIDNNIVSSNQSDGIRMDNPNAAITIQSNLIGLSATPGAILPNQGDGIAGYSGTGPNILNNQIAGNIFNGIYMADMNAFSIKNNFIGTDASLSPGIGNNLAGIEVYGGFSVNSIIGGTGIGDENTIINNTSFGVYVNSNANFIGILRNLIFNNGDLGISLNSSSPLVNDLGDADASAALGNTGRNYPDNLLGTICSSGPSLSGDMEVDAAGDYLIQVFRINPGAVDPSGNGEGNEFINEITLTLSAGYNTFNIPLPGTVIANDILSLTASYFNGTSYSTSEFSDTVLVKSAFTATASVTNNVLCFGGSTGTITVTHGGSAPFSYNWIEVGVGTTGLIAQTVNVPVGSYVCQVTDATCSIYSDTIIVTQPTALSITPTVTNVTCNGANDGTIDITITGGTGPYVHDWNNDGTGDFDDPEDLTPIGVGLYTVVVNDVNGCSLSNGPINVIQPSALNGTPTVTPESCDGLNDGSIIIIASGGTPGYLYQVDAGGYVASNSFTGLSDGLHTWNIQDANGCIFGSSSTINQGEIVTANFSANNGCEDQPVINFTDLSSAPSSISFWNWSFSGASPSAATIQNVSNVMFFTPGSNNVTLTVTSGNGCTAVTTIPVTIFQNPNVNAGADISICQNDPFTQNATITNGLAPYSISWTPAGDFVNPTIEDAVMTAAATSSPGVTSYFLNVTDMNGCLDGDTMILTVNSLPTVIAPADYNVCLGNPTTLNGSGTAVSYNWDNSVIDGSPFSPTSTLTYTVTGVDGNSCQATDQVIITVDVPYTVNAGTDFAECENISVINFIASTNSPTFNWTTSNGNGFFTNGTVINPQYNTVANDTLLNTITFTLTTAANGVCPAQFDDVIVTMQNMPVADAGTAPSNLCNNMVLTLTGNSIGSTNYNWTTTGLGTLSTPSSVNCDYTPSNGEAGNIILYFNVISSNLCPNTYDSLIVNVLATPSADAGLNTTICNGQSITLDGSASVGTSLTYSWDEVGGANVGTFVTTSVNPSVNTDYVLTVFDGVCPDDDTISITVVAAPDASFTYTQVNYCQNNSNVLPATINTAGGTFSMPSASSNINATTGEITFSLLSPGQHTIYYTLTTPCIAVDSFIINVFTLPDVTINGPAVGCSNAAISSLLGIFNPTETAGTWSGTGVSGGNFDPSSSGAGSFIVTYSHTDANGCFNQDTALIIINQAPVVSISGVASAYCQTDAPFNPIGTPIGGIWSLDAGPYGPLTSVDPSSLTNGIHSLNYQYTDGNGCTSYTVPGTAFTVYTMPTNPTTTMPTSQTICAGNSLSLVVSNPNGGGTTIAWYADAGYTILLANGPTYNTPPLTSSTQFYAVIQNPGCISGSIIFNITVNSAMVNAGPDLYICPGTQAQLNVSNVTSGTVSWSPGITLNDSTIQNPIATPNVNTSYVVTVTNGPCISSDTVDVVIDGSNPNCGIVPSFNAFSPDGDGVNDIWIIDAALLHPLNKVVIFNRWGDVLVEFENYDNVNVVWDGMYKGEILPSGTYFYVISYLDINIQISGWVQLTR